jgi:hypothetical protein
MNEAAGLTDQVGREWFVTPELAELIKAARERTSERDGELAEKWGLAAAERWKVDLQSGLLRFRFADHVLEGPAQVLGTYSEITHTWLWGWANEAVAESMRTASEAVRAAGQRPGLRALAERKLDVYSVRAADDLACVTVLLAELNGVYRTHTNRGYAWLGLTGFQRRPLD